MKLSPNSSILPNYFTAMRFMCQCFGIQEKDLGRTLERIRENTPSPNKHFPKDLSRMMLARAENGTGRWCDALVVVGHESLYNRIRRQHGNPLFSSTGSLADRLVFSMLKVYEMALPKLRTHGVEREDALWVLVEHLFVPTAFVVLVHHWREGLGSEFHGADCWYLPTVSSKGKMKPIPRVLDCWLRVTGFRTAYGVSEEIGSKNLRRELDLWLAGTVVPTQETLHRLVDRFAKNVCWLGHPDQWKARFTLACAMQKLCDNMDCVFNNFQRDSSFTLGQMFRGVAEERIVCDENKFLAQPRTFFAARLLQRRMEREKNWDREVLERGQCPRLLAQHMSLRLPVFPTASGLHIELRTINARRLNSDFDGLPVEDFEHRPNAPQCLMGKPRFIRWTTWKAAHMRALPGLTALLAPLGNTTGSFPPGPLLSETKYLLPLMLSGWWNISWRAYQSVSTRTRRKFKCRTTIKKHHPVKNNCR